MALDQAWILVLCVGIIVGISAGVFLFLKNKTSAANNRKALFANTHRITKTPEYKKLMSNYKKGIIASLSLLILVLLSGSMLAAKPVSINKDNSVKYNRDVVLCLDVSGSMTQVDIEALDRFMEMSEGFKGERVALVIFNSTSNQVFPLTDDYEYIQEQFKMVQKSLTINPLTGLAPDGSYDILTYTLSGEGASLIGDGLAGCALSFDESENDEKRSRSIIIATDNVLNGIELVPLQEAADYAKEKGITVYGINPDEEVASSYGVVGEEKITAKQLALEAQEPFKVAVESTGGNWYLLNDPESTPAIIDKITSEETSAIVGKEVITKVDVPQGWIIVSLLGLTAFIGLAWRFRL
jgi:Ca-activated chloride channel family protein